MKVKILVSTLTVSLCITTAVLLSSCDNGYDAGYKAGHDEGYQQGISEGHDKGYEEGYDSAQYAVPQGDIIENYYAIEDMDTGEIINFLEDRTGQKIYTDQEPYGIYVFGFLHGYSNAKNGIWDDETKEYINGWDYDILKDDYGADFAY